MKTSFLSFLWQCSTISLTNDVWKKIIYSDPRSSKKQSHENSKMAIKHQEDFNRKKINCQPFSMMIFNSFSLILQHIYLCQFQSYLFLNPKNTNFAQSNPWRFTVPWHKVLPNNLLTRDYFSQMQLSAFSKAVVQLLAGSLDNRNNNDATDLSSLVDLQATQSAITHLGVIWNQTK